MNVKHKVNGDWQGILKGQIKGGQGQSIQGWLSNLVIFNSNRLFFAQESLVLMES